MTGSRVDRRVSQNDVGRLFQVCCIASAYMGPRECKTSPQDVHTTYATPRAVLKTSPRPFQGFLSKRSALQEHPEENSKSTPRAFKVVRICVHRKCRLWSHWSSGRPPCTTLEPRDQAFRLGPGVQQRRQFLAFREPRSPTAVTISLWPQGYLWRNL